VALLLSRQGLVTLDQEKYGPAENLSKGAYVLVKADKPDVLLLGSGSEVGVAIEAGERLAAEGVSASVVSMPCWELFEKQSNEYKDSVLPPSVKARVGSEAATEMGWSKYLGDKGIFIGMASFGTSAPAKTCFEKFGITVENVIKIAKKLIIDPFDIAQDR